MGDFSEVETRWVPSTLRGFRQWKLLVYNDSNMRPISVRLGAVYWDTFWEGGQITATCLNSVDTHKESTSPISPVKECTCGIYCLGFPAEYETGSVLGSEGGFVGMSGRGTVNGVAKCGGKVQFGLLGFRAQHAAVEAIHLPHPETDYQFYVREIFKETFPNIAVFADYKSMYEQYPEDDFTSLYPKETHQKIIEARKQHVRGHELFYRSRYARFPPLINYYPGKIIDFD